jgi:hypothetical protein
VRFIVLMMAMYLHLGPFSRRVVAEIDRRIAAEDAALAPLALTAHAHAAAPLM